ncbi:MAG TPA: hypothetical protein VMJ33_04165 [Gallionella sp.]|nr:hypothetical protein [Gallionella sp.]
MKQAAVKISIISQHPDLERFLFRVFGIVAAVLVMSGCTSQLIHVDLSKIAAPPPGEAVIFIIRPSYLSYGSRDLYVRVNNTEIASLPRLSYTSFLISAGNMTLSGEGSWFSWPLREITVDIKDGKQYYLVWTVKETASSALMLYLFPTLEDLRWNPISRDDAQKLLNGIYYVEPVFQEAPR